MCNHADTLLVCACVMLPSICDKLSPTYRLNEVAKGNALSPGHGCYVRHLAPPICCKLAIPPLSRLSYRPGWLCEQLEGTAAAEQLLRFTWRVPTVRINESRTSINGLVTHVRVLAYAL